MLKVDLLCRFYKNNLFLIVGKDIGRSDDKNNQAGESLARLIAQQLEIQAAKREIQTHQVNLFQLYQSKESSEVSSTIFSVSPRLDPVVA